MSAPYDLSYKVIGIGLFVCYRQNLVPFLSSLQGWLLELYGSEGHKHYVTEFINVAKRGLEVAENDPSCDEELVCML